MNQLKKFQREISTKEKYDHLAYEHLHMSCIIFFYTEKQNYPVVTLSLNYNSGLTDKIKLKDEII